VIPIPTSPPPRGGRFPFLSGLPSRAARIERGTAAYLAGERCAVSSAGFSTFSLMYAVHAFCRNSRRVPPHAAESSLALSLTTACLAFSILVCGAGSEQTRPARLDVRLAGPAPRCSHIRRRHGADCI